MIVDRNINLVVSTECVDEVIRKVKRIDERLEFGYTNVDDGTVNIHVTDNEATIGNFVECEDITMLMRDISRTTRSVCLLAKIQLTESKDW